MEAAGLGGTKNADTLRTILESKKYKSALGPEKLDLKKVNEITSWIKESYPDALVVTYEDFFAILKKYKMLRAHVQRNNRKVGCSSHLLATLLVNT